MSRNLNSEYFNDLERNFPEHVVPEYKRCIVTTDQMRTLLLKRSEGASPSNFDLILDMQSGLFYANHDFAYCDDLLANHLFAELLFAKKDKVDWKRMTDCYNYDVMEKIDHLLFYPLVWMPISDVRTMYVVDGDVAGEVMPPENFSFADGRYGFYNDMRERGLLWFADTMPTKEDVYNDYRYDDMPDTMILWDRFLFGGYRDIRLSLDYIIAHRGHAKAVEIVERFRQEWNWFVTVKFYDFQKLDNYEKERYRRALFEELDPYLHSWKIKAGIPDSTKTQDTSKPTEMHFHFEDKVNTLVASADNVNFK